MSAVEETASIQPPKPTGSITLKDLALPMTCVALLGGAFISTYQGASAHDRVRDVIEEKVLNSSSLQSCSLLIDTQRHEGKCGNFGKYTVLSGGKTLFVFEGPSTNNPPVVGRVGFWGFRASQELRKFALGG